MAKKNTTIQLSTETREELKSLGSKGETYNEIIIRLIRRYRVADVETDV